MFNKFKFVLIFLPICFNFGCTKLSPELGFGGLSSSKDSLTLESSTLTINASTANSAVILKGICESNINLQLTAASTQTFRCENLAFSKSVAPSDLIEGVNVISVVSLDDSKNIIASKEIKILKDTVVPLMTLSAPATISGSATTIAVSGTCSENGTDVQISESTSGSTNTVTCLTGAWTLNYAIQSMSQTDFHFSGLHKDVALNQATTAPFLVNKIVLGEFAVSGVSNTSSGYSTLLKLATGNLNMAWTASTGAAKYNIKIKKIIGGPGGSTYLDVCQFDDVVALTLTKSIGTYCPSMTNSEYYLMSVEAKDSSNAFSLIKTLIFRTKAPPRLQTDANKLFVNSDFGSTPPISNISYSSIILDLDSAGPFTAAVTDSAGLGSQIAADNVNHQLVVTPLENTSGIFSISVTFTDENGLTSAPIPVSLAIVFPYSWAGLVDNNFNNPLNWCGSSTLKAGCSGGSTAPSSTIRVMIDNLCDSPITAASGGSPYCSPRLGLNTTVKSFFMKDKFFYHNSHSFIVGTSSDNSCYLKLSGGLYNDMTSTGDLTVFREFLVTGGVFTAPASSNVFFNTLLSGFGAESFKVLSNSYYVHNNSTLHLLDPNGQGPGVGQKITLPPSFHLKNLTINSNGGHWVLKSDELILDGDLTFIGTKDSSGNYPKLNAYNSISKITLKGNINCEGEFNGGTAPIYIDSSVATYKSTFAGCKILTLRIANAGSTLRESASSTVDLVLQGLLISAGSFEAPINPRKTIYRTNSLDNNSTVVDISAGYTSNGTPVVFETNDDSNNYKLNLTSLPSVTFTNPNNLSSFYEISSDFATNYLVLSGSFPVPLRGSTKTIFADNIDLSVGMVLDASRLNRITLSNASSSAISVNTNSAINLPNLNLLRSVSMSGLVTLNFPGTVISLNTFNLSIPSGLTLRYYSSNGSGSIVGPGTKVPGQ